MGTSVSVEGMREALRKVSLDAAENAETLRRLDAAAGDGDLGVTMTIGWTAVREALPTLGQGDLGSLLAQAGMTFNKAAASTFGVLLATALMRAGRELKGQETADLADMVRAMEGAFQGIKDRGKAEVGDKTMLDALAPAIAALKEAQQQEASLDAAFDAAATAAMSAAEATVGMTPKFGRASWLGPRAAEVQDPGATATAIMLRSFAEALKD